MISRSKDTRPMTIRNGTASLDPTRNVLDLVQAESKYQDAMREAETRRIDELATLRKEYDNRIADMLRDSVSSTSKLISTQLTQIQAVFDTRISKLEQFRWESGGRSSVSDPALADTITSMAKAVEGLKTGSDQKTGSVNTWSVIGGSIIAGGGLIIAIVAVILDHMLVKS